MDIGVIRTRTAFFLSHRFYAMIILICAVSACDWQFSYDNANQKKVSSELREDLIDLERQGALTLHGYLSVLQSYPNECRLATPAVPHTKCLQLAVESKDLPQATQDSMNIARIFGDLKHVNKLALKYQDYYVVLVPIARISDYKGDVTPSSLGKNFLIGKTFFLKIRT
jgi:hypothetical protein